MDEQTPTQPEQNEVPPQPQDQPSVEPPAPESSEEITGVDESHLYAALSYLFLLVFIPLLTRKNDEFVMYHARQGLILFVVYIFASIIAIWAPVLGNLLFLLLVIISIVGVIQALKGRRWNIPVITSIADKFHI